MRLQQLELEGRSASQADTALKRKKQESVSSGAALLTHLSRTVRIVIIADLCRSVPAAAKSIPTATVSTVAADLPARELWWQQNVPDLSGEAK